MASRRDETPVDDDIPPTTQLPEEVKTPEEASTTQLFPKPSILPPPPRRRHGPSRARIVHPTKDSLYDIMHQHCGTSLFLRPPCWTDQHATLLGARFFELPPCDSPVPINVPGSLPSRGHLRPSPAVKTLSEALTQILLPTPSPSARSAHPIPTIMSTLWPASFSTEPQACPELHMFFGHRVYRDAVRTQFMWSYPASGPRSIRRSLNSTSARPADSHGGPSTSAGHSLANKPMMCYISKNSLVFMRHTLFRMTTGPGRTVNEPVRRLQRARTKILLPANPNHDVQFVAIFLALAQRHFYPPPARVCKRDTPWWTAKGPPPRPDFHDIKLRILTHDTETAEFILYTGHVAAKFLERFHEPSKTPLEDDGSVPGLAIEYTRIPIWPILGLRERLGKALGEDIVGPFDPTTMETWDDEDDEKTQTAGKRKREALSEVFNGSFEEATDDESERLSAKSQCLGKGPQVGVVM
ncbi:hypothetical protein OCS_02327 [Ophiocordyceps sinensis CO18]|nr:hypothetical protein OCS_02327 [Ophiocordyceps sinensis CO18]